MYAIGFDKSRRNGGNMTKDGVHGVQLLEAVPLKEVCQQNKIVLKVENSEML